MSRSISRAVAPLLVVVLLFAAFSAYAKTRQEFSVSYDRLWSTALRLIRVDLAYEVKDRDKEAGYVVFEYKLTNGRTSRASLEIVPATKEPIDKAARFYIHVDINEASSVEERMILDALNKKLHEEGAL